VELRIPKDLPGIVGEVGIDCKGVSEGEQDKFAELRILKKLRVLLADVLHRKELSGASVRTAGELNAETPRQGRGRRREQKFRGEATATGCVVTNTGNNSTVIHHMSMYLWSII
jgi:hypothetical protein